MGVKLNKLFKKATSETTHTDIYRTEKTDTNIKMSLAIGAPGQSGISKVKIGNKILLDDHDGAISNLLIGTNNELNNRFLTVKTAVTDIKGKPDDTSIDFSITGGPDGLYSFKLSKTVTTDGDTVFYEIEIFFYN
jgi:hypothetical protein